MNRRINVNGGFDEWQMGEYLAALPHHKIGPSMWRNMDTTTGVKTVEKSPHVPSVEVAGRRVRQSMKMTCTTPVATMDAGKIGGLVYFGEGIDWRVAHEQPLSLGFEVESSKAGVFHCGIRTGKAPFYTCPMRYEIAAANEFQRVELQIPPSPNVGGWTFDNDVGFALFFFFGFSSMWAAAAGEYNEGALGGGLDQANWYDTLGATFHLSSVQLEVGEQCTPFEEAPHEDRDRCRRYIRSSFQRGAMPSVNAGAASGNELFYGPRGANGWQAQPAHVLDPPMRAAPEVTVFNPSAANNQMRCVYSVAGTPGDCSNTSVDNITPKGFRVAAQAPATVNVGDTYGYHWLADASVPSS